MTALQRCRREGAWSGQVMDEIIRKASLEKREAALASRLCLGVIQNSSLCRYYIDCFSTVKSNKLEPKVLDLLCMGVYQILFMKIPARAAVNESVTLCRKCGFDRAAGLVNAVLRRIAEHADCLPPVPNEGTGEHLAIKYSHSPWLVERLLAQQGYERTEAFLACNNQPAPLTIQVNTLRCSACRFEEMLAEQGIAFQPHPWLSGCYLLSSGNVQQLPGYEEGYFYVQDAAARAAAEIAGAEPGMHVLDACAAPGGKSFATAIRMKNQGLIRSCDIHAKKLRLVQDGASRLGISVIETQAADARTVDFEGQPLFDLVIADVPCSGFGVIRKKPEIRWKQEQEIGNLPQIQADILDHLSRWVRPGGILLYATCTVLREENEAQVEAFLARHEHFQRVAFTLGEEQIPEGMHCFWPDRDGTDGFFAAKLMRTH